MQPSLPGRALDDRAGSAAAEDALLSMKPEKIAETGAGAWLWASGSQVCIGARPALVP